MLYAKPSSERHVVLAAGSKGSDRAVEVGAIASSTRLSDSREKPRIVQIRIAWMILRTILISITNAEGIVIIRHFSILCRKRLTLILTLVTSAMNFRKLLTPGFALCGVAATLGCEGSPTAPDAGSTLDALEQRDARAIEGQDAAAVDAVVSAFDAALRDGGEDAASTPDVGVDAYAPDAFVTAPPTLAITAPRIGTASVSRRTTVRGTATDDVGVVSLVLTRMGAEPLVIVPAADGSFAVDIDLAPGSNTLTLTAIDADDQATVETRAVHYGHRLSGGNSQGAVIYDGELLTWGRNELGQLGNGSLVGSAYGDGASASLPLRYQPAGVPDLVSIVTRQTFMIALRSSGQVVTWGSNSDGQLGYAAELDCGSAGTSPCRRLPTDVPGLTNAIGVAAGFNHSLVLLADGTVVSFGQNTRGQLGYPTPSAADQLVPQAIPGLTEVIQLAAGSTNSAALTRDGQVWVWGDNQYGHLADGTSDTLVHAVPTAVPGITDAVAIASGNATMLALLRDGTVVAWGRNQSGQAGNGLASATLITAPTPVLAAAGEPLTEIESIAADGFVSLAVTRTGGLYAWGLGSLGQLGMGTLADGTRDMENRAFATRVPSPGLPSEFIVVEAEGGAGGPTFALTTENNLLGWGWSFQGSLGFAAAINAWAYTTPVLVYPVP